MFTIFVAFIPIVLVFLAYGMERFPDRLTKQKSDTVTKKQKDDLGYLFPIGEDKTKTLDEEMYEAISHFKRLQLGKIGTNKWKCKRMQRNYAALCNEWKKRWTSLTVYLDYYSEFGRHKMGTKIEKALRREKGGNREETQQKKHLLKVKMAQRIERTGMLDHLAIKPHFKATADGSMLTFTEAISQCFSAYKALFGPQKCLINKYFCFVGAPSEAQIRPASEFVNEKECVFVNDWVRAYKRAKSLGDNDPRMGAQILLSSIVPRIENDETIAEETLKFKPYQFPAPLNRNGSAFWNNQK